jgi:hypothetical protein
MALGAAALLLPAVAKGSAEPIQQPELAQRRHFAIFNTPSEAAPPIIAGSVEFWLQKTPAADRGFNPALIQRAQPPGSRRSIWLVPGRRSIMIVEIAPAGKRPWPKLAGFECSSTEHAIRSGLGLSVAAGHSVGLVPDGVIGVVLSKTLVAPVGQNVFSASGRPGSWFDRWRFIHGASATGG